MIKSFPLWFSLERLLTAEAQQKKCWNHSNTSCEITLFKFHKTQSWYHYIWKPKHNTCLYFWGRLQPNACTLPSSFWTCAFTWRYCSLFCSLREAKLASVL